MKKLLLSLFVSFVWLISFCSAWQYTYSWILSNGSNSIVMPIPQNYLSNDMTLTCVMDCDWNWLIRPYQRMSYYYWDSYSTYNPWIYGAFDFECWQNSTYIFSFSNYVAEKYSTTDVRWFSIVRFNDFNNYWTITYSCTFSWDNIIGVSICSPQYTSEECQSEYDLVSSSNLTTCQSGLNSCQTSLSWRNNTLNNCSNNLLSCESSLASCIQSNCPIDTWDVMWSSLWINWIQHLWKSVINVSIPDNIYWDYITNDESFDLYIGSGYDQEYIDWIISINSYSPTSEDFTRIFVSGLTLIMPYIIFALFIVFLWKLIKRIFK